MAIEARQLKGLYRKALRFHESVEPPESAHDGVSAEERAKIASHIDGILAGNRIQISPKTLAYAAKRHGALLPIFTNVAVFAAFILAGFVIFQLLNHQEQFIATGRTTVQGAENKLIAAIRSETEQQLRSRDQAILDAQQKLQALSQQEQQLRTQADAAVKLREQQLSAELDQKLAQEKDRLAKQGLSDQAQSERLSQFAAARQQELDRQLGAARRRAEADLAERQKALAAQSAAYQSELDSARQQRVQLEKDLAQREADLRAQQAQASQSAQVGQELTRLREQRDKEQLILDQILAGYSQVNAALEKSDFAEAQKGLDSLRAYLDDPTVATLPTVQKRRAVELFLINSLSDLVRSRRLSDSTQAASQAEAGAQMRSISELVARGDRLAQAGNLADARAAYLQALQAIAPVSRGYQRLEEVRAADGEQGGVNRAALAGLRQANLFYQAGNLQGSLAQYRQAVGLLVNDDALARQLTDNMMNAGYRVLAADDLAALARLRTDAQKRQAILARLQQVRSQYLAYAALSPPSSDPRQEQTLASLLQAKILLLQILGSDPVRSQHPELGRQIEQYFAALEQQGKAEGRKAAVDEVSSALGLTPAPASSAADSIVALLDRLQQILSTGQ